MPSKILCFGYPNAPDRKARVSELTMQSDCSYDIACRLEFEALTEFLERPSVSGKSYLDWAIEPYFVSAVKFPKVGYTTHKEGNLLLPAIRLASDSVTHTDSGDKLKIGPMTLQIVCEGIEEITGFEFIGIKR